MSGDIFDIRDVIKRFEELEAERQEIVDRRDEAADLDQKETYDAATLELAEWDVEDGGPGHEFGAIDAFLSDVKGYGGDEQWRGEWYPLIFIADSYFERYAQEFAYDIGAINIYQSWPNNCIDWEQAASQLKQDYSSVTIDGEDYWYR
jgi:hypothetical protein